MEAKATKLRQIKEFARDAGVTVRALHLYDRRGLLKPAALSESGYRLYGQSELERLEQILALRFIGFTLEQIKELLDEGSRPIATALRLQREIIARQARRLETALRAIDEAQCVLSREPSADLWATLRTVIEVFQMQSDREWTKKYYSAEALAEIEENRKSTPPEIVAQGEREWRELIAEVENAATRGVASDSDEARALADRWRALLGQFTRGNPEVQRGLNRLWSDSTHWPADFKRPWSDTADAFIKKALE